MSFDVAQPATVAALLALTGCPGPSTADEIPGEGESEAGDDGEACPRTGLHLDEAVSGHVAAAVMFDEAHGGVDYTQGVCGGAGRVDQSYWIESRKSDWYRITVEADNGEPLVVHVHTGDACTSPEALCEVGDAFSHERFLAEGESLVVVVEATPDLTFDEGEFRYSIGVHWSSPPAEPCDVEALSECIEAPAAEFLACLGDWACGDFETAASCQAALGDAGDACREMHCSDGPYYPDHCESLCEERWQTCTSGDGCDDNTCTYERYQCASLCGIWNGAWFEFELEDTFACELPLPGPPTYSDPAYLAVIVGDEGLPIGEPGATCDDPGVDAVWTSETTLTLCSEACDAFALAGSATVQFGAPPPP